MIRTDKLYTRVANKRKGLSRIQKFNFKVENRYTKAQLRCMLSKLSNLKIPKISDNVAKFRKIV